MGRPGVGTGIDVSSGIVAEGSVGGITSSCGGCSYEDDPAVASPVPRWRGAVGCFPLLGFPSVAGSGAHLHSPHL